LQVQIVKVSLLIMGEDLEVNSVASALHTSIGLFLRRVRQSSVQADLSLPEISALSRLERAGSATTSDLARVDQITPQAMGATLAALEERGLVERRPDPSDGRRITLSVTAAGLRALRDKRSARTEQVAKALASGFTQAEIEILGAAAPLIERLGESL
jgi:DNA-binding MarR family transcriptional regulator